MKNKINSLLVVLIFLVPFFPNLNLVSGDIETPRTPNALVDHIVISEIQVSGSGGYDEFIELYNPTGDSVSLSGWTIQYIHRDYAPENDSGSHIEKFITFDGSDNIASHGFYLIAHTDYNGAPTEDATYSVGGLSAIGGHIILVNSTNNITSYSDANIVDYVGYGTAQYPDGGVAAPAPTSDESIERKAYSDSDATDMAASGSHETEGNAWDTDNNADDFVAQTIPVPQSSASGTENFPELNFPIILCLLVAIPIISLGFFTAKKRMK